MCLLNLCIDTGTGTFESWKHVQRIIGMRTETKQRINTVHCSRGIYLFICLFTCDYRTICFCKRQDMSKTSSTSLLLK